jgi:hypothetical protein
MIPLGIGINNEKMIDIRKEIDFTLKMDSYQLILESLVENNC